MRTNVTLDGNALAQLTANPEIVAMAPALERLKNKSCCDGVSLGDLRQAALRQLYALPADKRERLKALLDTKKISFHLQRPGQRKSDVVWL